MKVVCNSTVLIGLAKLEKLDILNDIFGEIIIPEEVYQEVVIRGRGKLGANEIQEAKWLKRKTVKDNINVRLLSRHLSQGEAEVLTLGKELKADLLILDEDEARDSASSAGFKIIGLVGILLLAKNMGLIKKVKPLLDELRSKRFYIGNTLYRTALEESREL